MAVSRLSRRNRPISERQAKNILNNQGGRANRVNAQIESVSFDGEVMTITADRPIFYQGGATGIQTNLGEDEISAMQPAQNQIAITYADDVSSANEVILPNVVQNVRSRDGGFLVSGTFPVAT